MCVLALIGTTAIGNAAIAPTIDDNLGGGISDSTQTSFYQPHSASSNDLKAHLSQLSIQYGVNYSELLAVINCESGFDNSARGKAGEIGLAQFMPATWEFFNKLRGTKLDITNPYDQISMIVWSFSEGLQNHWTCYKLIKKNAQN